MGRRVLVHVYAREDCRASQPSGESDTKSGIRAFTQHPQVDRWKPLSVGERRENGAHYSDQRVRTYARMLGAQGER